MEDCGVAVENFFSSTATSLALASLFSRSASAAQKQLHGFLALLRYILSNLRYSPFLMAELHALGQANGHQNGSNVRVPTGDCPPDCNEALNARLVRDIATTRSISIADATVCVLSTWHTAYDRAVSDWEALLKQRAASDAAAARAAQDEANKLAQDAEAALLAEAAKKKAKNSELDITVTLGSDLLPSASALTFEKTRDFKWTPLWAYGWEACAEARDKLRSESGRTIDLVTDSAGSLSIATSSRESPRAVPDEQLTWDQILEAKTVFLAVAAQVGWTAALRLIFAQFFLNLDSHWMLRVKPVRDQDPCALFRLRPARVLQPYFPWREGRRHLCHQRGPHEVYQGGVRS